MAMTETVNQDSLKSNPPLDADSFVPVISYFMTVAGQLQDTGLDKADEQLEYLYEEIRELQEAIDKGDEIEIDDALIDIAVTAISAVYKRRGHDVAGLMVGEVSRANLSKVSPLDKIVRYPGTHKVGKPEGWIGPRHDKIIEAYG
jgi:hypothetical protein